MKFEICFGVLRKLTASFNVTMSSYVLSSSIGLSFTVAQLAANANERISNKIVLMIDPPDL